MKIVINSHNKSTIALNHLLDSMKILPDFHNYEFIIAIGGYYELNNYEIEKQDNITYIKCNHNSIDYTGLIALYELYKDNIDDYYFYMHDTCRVGPNFFDKLKTIDMTGITSMKICCAPGHLRSMNMGIYSQKIINSSMKFLIESKNTDENKCMDFKTRAVRCEDYIFNSDKNSKIIANCTTMNVTEPTDYYNTGVMRIVEYYPNIDLYKIKANWYIKKWELRN